MVLVRFPDPEAPEMWDPLESYDSATEAMRACSHAFDLIANLLRFHGQDPDDAYRRIRISDALCDRWVLWAGESSGELCFDPSLFDGPVPLDS